MFRGDRLAALLAEKGISQNELARRVGVSQATIWKLASQPTQGSKHIHRIASELGTSAEYLMDETDNPAPLGGQPIVMAPAVEPDGDLVQIDSIDLAFGLGGTFLDLEDVEVSKMTFSRTWLRKFTPSPPNLLFFTEGQGDSMMPTIHDRDVVIIDRAQSRPDEVVGERIWACVFGGVGMLKRLRPMPDGTVKISSDNQLIRDELATDGDLHIIGRVVAIMKRA